MSIKECFKVKGYFATGGMSRFLDQACPKDGQFVQGLKDKGAVPFCLTNVPQTMKSYGCSNPIYGSTSNPLDKRRSPGGSSGGEACLIASGGSLLGIGTDVGGSLRIPAHFCGVVGMKPTTGRIYQKGRITTAQVLKNIYSIILLFEFMLDPDLQGKLVGIDSNAGFMSKNVDGIAIGMQVLLEDPAKMVKVDSDVIPVPWNKDLLNPGRKYVVGWYVNFFQPK